MIALSLFSDFAPFLPSSLACQTGLCNFIILRLSVQTCSCLTLLLLLLSTLLLIIACKSFLRISIWAWYLGRAGHYGLFQGKLSVADYEQDCKFETIKRKNKKKKEQNNLTFKNILKVSVKISNLRFGAVRSY